MASRLKLHEELCELLGSRYVYFNPPESKKLDYPCIVYSQSGVSKLNANDRLYKKTNQYKVTIIDPDPDSDIYNKLLEHFSLCSYDTGYPANGLNHDVLTLFY